jgi:hypothetical protein
MRQPLLYLGFFCKVPICKPMFLPSTPVPMSLVRLDQEACLEKVA